MAQVYDRLLHGGLVFDKDSEANDWPPEKMFLGMFFGVQNTELQEVALDV